MAVGVAGFVGAAAVGNKQLNKISKCIIIDYGNYNKICQTIILNYQENSA